ncbi:MAG: SpoIID/LytB domain-containing protein [Lachnospiraceae bacterium]|jgi:stage II sporulation protein D|nr:SpoIID/LytB domain-containing protein [Lachnospiraceae bacterium]
MERRDVIMVENKRIVPGVFLKYLGAILLFVFLLPYVITAIFNNVSSNEVEGQKLLEMIDREDRYTGAVYVENITAAGSERIPLEIYLVDRLSRVIDREFELEAMKAQAVLLRTALMEQLWKETGTIRGDVTITDEDYGHGFANDTFTEAVYSTQGVFLTYHDQPIKAPYFAVSNGKTRNGAEVFKEGEYPYLVSVVCNRDFIATKYTGSVTMSKSEFIAAWEQAVQTTVTGELLVDDMVIERDANDYITRITIEEQSLSGEQCRAIWGLDSACFQIEERSNKINFTVKGVGHGLGMSQFAANEMAIAEIDYIGILEYFFPETQLTKFE